MKVMFKKSVKVITVLLVVCIMACSLTACATKLNGKYTSDGLIEQSFTFKEDDVVVISAFGIDAEGTYQR